MKIHRPEEDSAPQQKSGLAIGRKEGEGVTINHQEPDQVEITVLKREQGGAMLRITGCGQKHERFFACEDPVHVVRQLRMEISKNNGQVQLLFYGDRTADVVRDELLDQQRKAA